ncbi:MAG TPA: dihydrolipoamide acetyltransferase family protein [Solirubrobacteraceae bacterium]|jgi:pyruvate dehydrogenase E2 component (dihydrolipoamide acetyltransferase)|nr:dihydrolipoamide acetyltransferase family protein [Solirubrobacteraceae bacterium]
MTDVVMPRLSDTMEEGTVLRWLKQDGEHVRRGEELVEIETDKAAMTYESDAEGLLQTLVHEGDTLAVGELIARIGQAGPGEPATGQVQDTGETPGAAAPPDGSAEQAPAEQAAAPARTQQNGAPSAPRAPADPERGGRPKASPLARRIAHETGVDLGALTGSGPGGRIVKADVEASTGAAPREPAAPMSERSSPTGESAPPSAQPASPVEEPASSKGESTTVEPTRTQRTIARRMAESKATIPDFTLTADVDMERCVELRAELKLLSHVDAPTYNDMIVKACALALREHPRANGGYRDGRFELHSRVNVGVAVAVASEDPTGGALVVPTVFDADTKALGEIARETRALAERVREGAITPPQLSGGTFTVSNLGMYGITSFTAIVNPPQAAILAVGAVAQRAVAHDGQLALRHKMSVTLACDHRILYGADAALFLARIRELLEQPAALTL